MFHMEQSTHQPKHPNPTNTFRLSLATIKKSKTKKTKKYRHCLKAKGNALKAVLPQKA